MHTGSETFISQYTDHYLHLQLAIDLKRNEVCLEGTGRLEHTLQGNLAQKLSTLLNNTLQSYFIRVKLFWPMNRGDSDIIYPFV